MVLGNIFSKLPPDISNEQFTDIIQNKSFRVERIVSNGHSSPEDFWYDQEQNEWVLVISGNAILEFKDEKQSLNLKAGDYILIPAHKLHRVASTDNNNPTIWLAIHFD